MTSVASSALPRAVLSRGALDQAVRAVRADGGSVADLRRDAWGHGTFEVAAALADAGIRALVDDEDIVARLRAAGVDATASGSADIDPFRLYGLPDSGIAPVLRLVGTVFSTKPLRAGDAVSYGYTHRADADTTVALVSGGYAQGIVRALGNRACVEIDGFLRPIVGRVAMDVCVVDLQGSDAEDGAEATYFGGTGPAKDALADWSTATGLTIGELIAVVGGRVRREWSA